MEPTYRDGQMLIVDLLTWRVAGLDRGDVIVFRNPHVKDEIDIKRVVGLPTETVLLSNTAVQVRHADGSTVTFPADSEIGRERNGSDFEMVLGPEDYFVLGDNRSHSTDSRSFGTVQPSDIIGRPIRFPAVVPQDRVNPI